MDLNSDHTPANKVFEAMIENGLLTIVSRNRTIRLLPPLTITKTEIDAALTIINQVLTAL
ncbi:MAG: aminotransferase class III-fold pyridoxal phosphate-dependent enzyme [Gammaproteobacteria bacterium]|nr:aminotransferase class III-fold pyridoxal phosphate-dependent enzyme [Gammaproteobacteria bacterium]